MSREVEPLPAARPLEPAAADRRMRARDLAIVLFVAFGGAIGAAFWVLWAGYPKLGRTRPRPLSSAAP